MATRDDGCAGTPATLNRDEVVRLLLRRLAHYSDSASDYDFPRIEELIYLLNAAMRRRETRFNEEKIVRLTEALSGAAVESHLKCPKCGLTMTAETPNIVSHCPRCCVAPPMASAR